MSRPIAKQSHSGATAVGGGESFNAKGHSAIALAVDATNLDATNDTLDVQIEVMVGGTWFPILDEGGNAVGQVSAGGLGGSGDALIYISNVPAPKLRANITSFSDAAGGDLTVDTYVLAANNGGTGHQYESP